MPSEDFEEEFSAAMATASDRTRRTVGALFDIEQYHLREFGE